MKVKVRVLRTDRNTYQKKNGDPAVAHRMTVVTPEGHAGELFLGGDNERGRNLYAAAAALGANAEAEVTFGFSSFRGELRTEIVAIGPAK